MASRGFLASLALGAVVALAAPAVAGAEPEPGPAGWLFDPGKVVRIDLGLPDASAEALALDPGEYRPGTFSLEGDGESFGPLDVGIRLKGSLGSFRTLDQKAAFKVKFDEYVDGQTFFGLEKLTLNNMIQDRSMIHEALSYELFRSLGVPASRTGYAFVSVNDEDFGLYVNVETLDAVALPRWFASTRHLYEGSYLNDVRPGAAGEFEVDEGKSKERDDLEALIAAANAEGGDWSEGMAAVADLEEMTLNWAAERYLGHWDGYSGRLVGHQPNNYFLHSEDSGVFRMLPWGLDQTWEARLLFDEPGGLLLNRCLADQTCAGMYRDGLREVRAAIAALDLDARAAELEGLLRPWQQIDPRREYRMIDIAAGVGRVRDFIVGRAVDLSLWLGEPVSAGTGAPPAGIGPPGAGAIAEAPAALLISGPVKANPRFLATELRTTADGVVEQRGTARISGRRQTVCFASARVAAGSPRRLRCHLSRAARTILQTRALRVDLTTCLNTFSGPPACTEETKRLPAASG